MQGRHNFKKIIFKLKLLLATLCSLLTHHFHVGIPPLVELWLEELGGALDVGVVHPVLVNELLEAVAERVGGQPIEDLKKPGYE